MSLPLRQPPEPGSAPKNHPSTLHTACFSIQAGADAGVMPRVLELFAKRNLIPTRWHSYVSEEAGDAVLTIDLQMQGLDPGTAVHIAKCLRNVWTVASVLTWEKAGAG